MKLIDNLVCKIMSNPKVEKAVESKGIAFFVETFTRLAAKKPVYWQIIQGIGVVVFIWNNIPLWLAQNGIPIPTIITNWENKTAGIIGVVVAITSQLATQSKVVTTDTTGTPLKQTDQTTMPFTAPIEANKVLTQGKAVTEAKP